MNKENKLKLEVTVEKIQAFPREGMTLDELEIKMAQIGNKVLEKNVEGNYLILQH